MPDPFRLLLIGAFGLTVAWGTYELSHEMGQIPNAPISNRVKTPPIQAPDVELPELEHYQASLSRPLFTKDRLPEAESSEQQLAEAAGKQKGPNKPPPFRLSAILVEDDKRSALLEKMGSKEIEQVRIGQTVSGWRITAMDDKTLTFASGSKTVRLNLYQFPKPTLRPSARKTKGKTARTKPQAAAPLVRRPAPLRAANARKPAPTQMNAK